MFKQNWIRSRYCPMSIASNVFDSLWDFSTCRRRCDLLF